MAREEHTSYEYLRPSKKFPNVWCSGCGIGIVMGSLIRAIDKLGLDKNEVALVSGIGCTGRMPVYMDFNTMHTTHGRALAFATGLKLARPELNVIVVMGDGDALAIGGNHFIHAARRNIDLTALVVNNSIYGMTGGQYSPTTPMDSFATTAPYGNIEQPLPICELARLPVPPLLLAALSTTPMSWTSCSSRPLLKKDSAWSRRSATATPPLVV
jgi:2-oxoglutarate/2-oxoacid ferredoxin oxidoreductase subunit beta